MKKFINDDNFKKKRLTKKYHDDLYKIIDQIIQNIKDKTDIIVLDEIGYVSVSLVIEIPPGA